MGHGAEAGGQEGWLTPGVRGIGTASLLADLGHEVPTALLPSLLTSMGALSRGDVRQASIAPAWTNRQ
jgi:hypothetical protein